MTPGLREYLICALILVWLCCGTTTHAAQMSLDGSRINDSSGRRLLVDQPFERIISLYGAHTENLFYLGAQSNVVGVSRNDDWPPQVKNKPVHSYHDDLEKFLAARPDLVLIRPMIDRGYRRLVVGLEAQGVKVISLQPSTPEEMFVYWEILGTITGRRVASQAMVRHFRQATQCIRACTSVIADKKRVYFESIHDRMRTFSPSAMPMYVLEIVGGVNVAGDAVSRRGTTIADYGKERILSHADEIDIYLAQVGPMNRPTQEIIRNEPGYGLIHAVRQGHIYLIDEKIVSRPTLRLLTGIYRVGQKLYPDVFVEGSEAMSCLQLTGGTAGMPKNKEK